MDTFCVQGGNDSLDNRIQQRDFYNAVVDSVTLHSTQNIALYTLTENSVRCRGSASARQKTSVVRDKAWLYSKGLDHSLSFPLSIDSSQYAAWHCAQTTAAHAVRGCFDQLDLDVLRAIQLDLDASRASSMHRTRPRCIAVDQLGLDARHATASLSCHLMARRGARDACSHTPDLDMDFTHATLQADPTNSAHRRAMTAQCTAGTPCPLRHGT
jgi:hypothetical protein